MQFVVELLSCVRLCQAPLSTGFSRPEYWRGLPFPSLGDLADPGFENVSPASPALAGGFSTAEPPGKALSDSSYFSRKGLSDVSIKSILRGELRLSGWHSGKESIHLPMH